MKHLFSEKIDSTSSNALEARKGKVEGHAGSKSKFSALNRRCTMVEGMETGRFLTGFKTLLLCPPHWGGGGGGGGHIIFAFSGVRRLASRRLVPAHLKEKYLS